VHRFHNRLPPGTGATTRDHRIELVTAGDMRPALRAQVPGLPTAPYYLIICLGTTGSWQELEAGFAACGAVLEASAMGLQGYLTADLSSGVQAGIRAATGIPSTDIPWVVVSLGQPSDAADAGTSWRAEDSLSLLIEGGIAFGDRVALRYALPLDAAVELDVFDCLGQKVRSLIDSQQAKGSRAAIWDCRDDRGRPVLSGVYFCRLNAEGRAAGARVVIVR
jgi:hypothetical protein